MKKIKRIISIILLGVDPYLEIRTNLDHNNKNIKCFSNSFELDDANLYRIKGTMIDTENEFWLLNKKTDFIFK